MDEAVLINLGISRSLHADVSHRLYICKSVGCMYVAAQQRSHGRYNIFVLRRFIIVVALLIWCSSYALPALE
eukprot:scaffold12369_cov94-Skeletonema_dohrnii-CCMP3373.AAC.1